MANWLLTVAETAELLGITERAVQKNVLASKYGATQYIESASGGGASGKALRIPLSGLPVVAQAKYLETHDIGAPPDHIEESEYDQAAAWQRDVADNRRSILRAYEEYIQSQPGKKTELGKQFVAVWKEVHPEDKLSLSNLYKWQANYRESGMAALLPGWGQNKGKHHSINQEALEKFYALYLQPQKPTVAECYSILVLYAKKNGWDIPSADQMRRIANQIPEAVRVASREGDKAFLNKVQTFTRRDPDSIQAGQVFVGDHQRMDFSIIGPNGKPTRPWLTAWLDMRSGRLVGWLICFTPCTDTIVAAFAEAALDPAIGLPREIYVDNGRDYCCARFAGGGFRGKKLTDDDKEALKLEGKRVDSLMERLKIKVHFAIPENARAKTIERVAFGNITGRFYKHMPTYCGSNPNQKPEDLSQRLKEMPKTFNITIEELNIMFSDWVRNVFNKTPSQKGRGREGECPDETFSRTRMPVRTTSEKALQYLFLKHPNPLKLGRNGIRIYGREYHAPEMILLKGTMVQVRYRPSDMSRIWLVDMDERPICEATLIEAIPAINANEEQIKKEAKRRKGEREAVKQHEAYQAAKQSNPETIAQITELYKLYGHKAPDVMPTDVIEMVALDSNVMEAARYVAATGTDNARAEISPWRRVNEKSR